MASQEKLRTDKYLWSIRLFKTRTLASEACDKGKVKMNGSTVKAAKQVNIGDELEVKTEAKRWLIRVIRLAFNRMKYSEAIAYYLDITPEDEVNHLQYQASSFNTGKRQSKIGRPTKKERRDLDEMTGGDAPI